MIRRVVARRAAWGGAQRGVLGHKVGLRGLASDGGSQMGNTTHFGYQTVREEEKKERVGEVFHRVADSYDVMNDLMSGGVHRLWKDEFVDMLGPVPSRFGETAYLDVAGGTGDISFRIADALAAARVEGGRQTEVVVCDINPSMLRVGLERAQSQGRLTSTNRVEKDWVRQASVEGATGGPPVLSFVEGDAEQLPFPDDTFDSYTIAFGIRNVTHIDKALDEAFRVLRPGGRFLCLEFAPVTTPGIAQLYDLYSFNIIPQLGEIVARDRDSYQYLVESIRNFPKQRHFASMIEGAGFDRVSFRNLTFGVAAIHSGFKPL